MSNRSNRPQINQANESLSTLVSQSEHFIYVASTVFPFKFFPDRIHIFENRIQLEYGVFFFSNLVQSFLIDDLITVHLSQGAIFSAVSFEVRGYEENPPPINYLKRRQASLVHDLIMGLIACKRENISLQHLQRGTLIKDLVEIGGLPSGA